MSKYDKYLTNGAVNKYAKYTEDPEKTFNQFESGLLGIRTGASLGTSDEASGGRAARAQILPKWANRAFDLPGGLPIVQAVQGAIDLGIGLTVENAPQFKDTQARRSYEAARDSDRLINETSRADNPYSMLAGEILGGVATGPPIATGAKSVRTVAAESGKRAVDLTAKAQKVTSATQKAALLKKAAEAQARAVRLARPATTMGEAAGRLGSQAVAGGVKGGAVGTVYGAGYGFGNAEGDFAARGEAAAGGAIIGGIGGAILTPAVQGLAKVGGEIVYKVRTPAEMKALDMVLKRAERSGTDLRAVKTQFDEWSKTGEVPETLAELMGPNERSLLSALVTVNRETREQAAGVFVGRGKEEVNRLEDAFSKSFGASRGDYQKTKVAAQQARAKEAEPFYEGAYVDAATGQRKFLGQPETDALVYEIGGSRVAQSTLSTASDYADALGQRAIRDEIDDFARAIKAGGPIKPLSVQAADYVERGINRRYNAASKGEAQDIPAGLKGLRDRVRSIIDPSGLGDARAVAREAIRRGELLDEGLGIMSPTVDVDDVEAVMRGLPDAGIPAASDAGRTAYGVGASRAVANKLRNVPDMAGFADAARTVARTPALREKLEAARPKVLTKSGAENKGSKQTKANVALDQAIERASDRAQFGVDMVGNSKTAFRQGDVTDAVMDDAFSQQAGEAIGDLLIAGAGGVTQKLQERLGRAIGNRIGQPSIYRPQVNREAANILLATGEQIPVQIARIAKRAAERANGRGRALPIAPPAGAAPAGAPVPPPPPIRTSGFTGLRTDAGNAAVGAGVGAFGPADSPEERLRNMAIGAGLGASARTLDDVVRIGAPRNTLADTATAGMGGNGSGNAGRFRFGPTGKAFNPWSTKVQDEIIRTSGGTIDARNIDDLMSTYTDDLFDSTPQEIVDTLRRQAGEVPLAPRDVEYLAFAELMARNLMPMRKGAEDILTAGIGGGGRAPIRVKGMSKGEGNKHGLMPHLRMQSSQPPAGKAKLVQDTNAANAPRQIDELDNILRAHPNALNSPQGWAKMMADALGSDDVPVAPYAFIRDIKDGTAQKTVQSLTPGQIADADHGFSNAAKMKEAYVSGRAKPSDTGSLFAWGFLSRGVSPYTQESLFIDAFNGLGKWIDDAANGTFDIDEYLKWAKTAAPKGSNQPGAGASHNLNAFGSLFLRRMSEIMPGTNISKMEYLHNLMSNPNMTGPQIRREFARIGQGVGIDNKVVSFTLLVSGRDDVMVLDRVQVRKLWNDGRFDGINLYDGYKVDGAVVTGSALSNLTYGARGLLVYEAIERHLAKNLKNIYAGSGREANASIGRYHWETWVADSQQEASHGTLDAVLKRMVGDEDPMAGVVAKQGEYGSYSYGARYGRSGAGEPFIEYPTPSGAVYRMTPQDFAAFREEIKKAPTGIIPRGKFSVSDAGDQPWYNKQGVNKGALDDLAARYGRRVDDGSVSGTDGGFGQGQNSASGRQNDFSGGAGQAFKGAQSGASGSQGTALPPIKGAGFTGFPQPPAPLTAGAATGAPVPPPKPPGKLGTRTADAAAIASVGLSGTADAQTQDGSAELRAANERVTAATQRVADVDKSIAQLEADMRLLEDPASDPRQVQDLLDRRGFDLGPKGLDGRIGPDTRRAIADNIAKIEGEIARKGGEREKAADEVEKARKGVTQAEMLQIQRDRETGPITQFLRDNGATIGVAAGLIGGYASRRGAVKKAAQTATKAAQQANALVNTNPVNRRSKKGPDGIDTRAPNLNRFWDEGGAGENVPFEAMKKGGWKPKPHAASPQSLYRPPDQRTPSGFIRSRVGTMDIGMMGAGVAEAKTMEGLKKSEQEKINAAQADVDRYFDEGNTAAYNDALGRLQTAKNLYATYYFFERAGYGFAGARALATIKSPYTHVRPNIASAEKELKLLRDDIAKP